MFPTGRFETNRCTLEDLDETICDVRGVSEAENIRLDDCRADKAESDSFYSPRVD